MWIPCSILSIGYAITPPQGSASSEQVAYISGSSVSSCGLSQARYLVPRSGDTSIVLQNVLSYPWCNGDKAQIKSKKGKVEKEAKSVPFTMAQELLHMSTRRWLRP